MKFEDLFDLGKIQQAEPQEVLDAAVQSILDLYPVVLYSEEMNELAHKMPLKAKFEMIEPHIKFEDRNGTFIIEVPKFDERKIPEYQVHLSRKNEYDCFPERGFFVTGDADLIIRPLGLIQVEINGLPVVRVDKDIRFQQTSSDIRGGRGYRENLYFYFDYDTKEFIKVYADKLEECRSKMEKNPSILSQYHESVQEYIKRESIVDTIIDRIYSMVIPYLPKLVEWENFEYGSGGLTIGSLKTYLNQYKNFLKTMDQTLKIKLIYSNVSAREFKELLKKKEELGNMITLAFKGLERIEVINSLSEEKAKDHKLTTDNFSQEENEITKILESNIIRSLQQFKEERPSQFPETSLSEEKILKGYIGYDLETNEVFPNIRQLQRRTSTTEEKEDFRSEKVYIARIIEELKKLKKQQN